MASSSVKGTPAGSSGIDYGIDAPEMMRNLASRGAMLFVLGIAIWFMNREVNPAGGRALMSVMVSIGLSLGAGAAVMYWSSKVAKLSMRDQILDSLDLKGDEKILDVGCGRGLMLIGAAKRLKPGGKATGVDVWSAADLSDNTAEAAMANARAEGVATMVRIENADARRLPYAAHSFDVVTSSLAIHNIPEAADRKRALDEMLRVVKPSGQIVIWDIFKAGEYLEHFRAAGAQVVKESGTSLLWCVPGKWFVVRKPASIVN